MLIGYSRVLVGTQVPASMWPLAAAVEAAWHGKVGHPPPMATLHAVPLVVVLAWERETGRCWSAYTLCVSSCRQEWLLRVW